MNSNNRQHHRNSQQRDRWILEHVARYRMTTLEVLRRVVLPGISLNAVNKITNRLCASGWLNKYTLRHPAKYFVLGDRGVRRFSVGTHKAGPLGPQSLPQEFALLAFCNLNANPHLRLKVNEIRQLCTWLPPSLARAPHCVDDEKILELVRVDLGGPADHVARKCVTDISARRCLPEFSPLLAAGRFRLEVITTTTGKAANIQRAIDRHHWPQGLLFHLSVLPQLLSIG